MEYEYCGVVRIRLLDVKAYDMFNMFKYDVESISESEFIVLPTFDNIIEEIELTESGDGEEEELQYKKGDDVSQISQIRNYIPGDKLQNIHWKLSSKTEELQVKEYSEPYSEDVIFCWIHMLIRRSLMYLMN